MSKTTTYKCMESTIRSPEGGNIKCASNSWIVGPGTKCKVTCDTGTPNYPDINCKQTHGWRPTNKLACEGVSTGVIIGALIGGIGGVVLLALIYAKYKQHRKKKLQAASGNQDTKEERRPGRRPGFNSGQRQSDDRPRSSGRNSRGSGNVGKTNSNPPSYNGDHHNGQIPPKPGNRDRPPPNFPQHGKRMRGGSQGGQQRHQPPPYGNDGPAIYDHENYPEERVAPQYPGFEVFNEQPAVGYGYAAPPQEPAVGYPVFQQPGYPSTGRDYGRPYQVPT